ILDDASDEAIGHFRISGLQKLGFVPRLSIDQEFESRMHRMMEETKLSMPHGDYPLLTRELALQKTQFPLIPMELINFFSLIYFECKLFRSIWGALYDIADVVFLSPVFF